MFRYALVSPFKVENLTRKCFVLWSALVKTFLGSAAASHRSVLCYMEENYNMKSGGHSCNIGNVLNLN